MNKQELASTIWGGANSLRGKVSAANYKDYMLGFLFYKYLSDKELKYLEEKLEITGDDIKLVTEENERIKNNCLKNIGYFISYENLFSTWVAIGDDFSIKNVTDALNAFDSRLINPDYRKVFENIFSSLSTRLTELGSTDPDRTKSCKNLRKLVKGIPTNGNEDYDVLGFIYEFLLKNFAANAGKAGEFYTPHEASVIMSEIIANHLKDRDSISIYDPTSGSGSLLINIGRSISKYIPGKNKVKYYAQEIIQETFNLTRMNLIMRDVIPSNIVARRGDTLEDDWPYFEDNDPKGTYNFLSVDACCSNPPYSQPWAPKEGPRFNGYGIAPKSKADYAFLLHNLYHLNKDGIMTIVLPHGVLFRGGDEATIRKNLINNHNIETIIGLPQNLFFGTGISTIIMVLKKKREKDDILFIDASKGFYKDGNKNRLRQRDIRKIVDTVLAREKEVPHYSRLVSYKEIEKNDFNLNISRYVDISEKLIPHDIYALMFGGIPNYEIDDEQLANYWKKFPKLKSSLFTKKDIPYSTINGQNILETIENDKDVQSFYKDHKDRYSFLHDYLEHELLDNPQSIQLDSEELKISNVIKDKLDKDGLIDYYDCFEALDNVWQQISLDLEIIKEQGLETAKQIEELKILKKDNKTKELEEKSIGFEGKIIPFKMIQAVYFADQLNFVQKEENNLAEYNIEKEELLNSIDPNDKEELLKDDGSGDIDTKKLSKKITDIKKSIKKGAEYESESYEGTLLKIDDIVSKISSLKKSLKKEKEELQKKTNAKITSLSDTEIHDLLVEKWVNPICRGIESLPNTLIKAFENKIKDLIKKYEITLTDVDREIDETEKELATMVDNLTGDDFDMKGIKQFKNLLTGGEKKNG